MAKTKDKMEQKVIDFLEDDKSSSISDVKKLSSNDISFDEDAPILIEGMQEAR